MTTAFRSVTPESSSKLSATDRKIFRGTAAEVHPWMTNDEILASIGCQFQVESHIPTVDGREYPDTRLWLRSDNRNHLGTFGNRRQVIQPSDFVAYFRDFCEKSHKAITLDLVGTPDRGKTFYMASKLTDSNLEGLKQEYAGSGFGIQKQVDTQDRTDSWLIITDYYGQSSAPKALVLFNELVCSNGMTKQTNSRLAGLTHLRQQDGKDVSRAILDAIELVEVYSKIKQKLIEKPITTDFALNAIKTFYRDSSKKADKLSQIYTENLIGGNLASRRGTAWGLLSAVTQNTTHGHIGSAPEGQGRAFKSLLDGPRAGEANSFCDFLVKQLAVA